MPKTNIANRFLLLVKGSARGFLIAYLIIICGTLVFVSIKALVQGRTEALWSGLSDWFFWAVLFACLALTYLLWLVVNLALGEPK